MNNAASSLSCRVRHLLSGVIVLAGAFTVTGAFVVAADGLRGISDVLQFTGTVAVSVWFILLGIGWSR